MRKMNAFLLIIDLSIEPGANNFAKQRSKSASCYLQVLMVLSGNRMSAEKSLLLPLSLSIKRSRSKRGRDSIPLLNFWCFIGRLRQISLLEFRLRRLQCQRRLWFRQLCRRLWSYYRPWCRLQCQSNCLVWD